MKNFIFKIRENEKIKKLLIIFMCVGVFAYTFSIPAFSGRPVYYLLSYVLMAFLAGTTVIYGLIYEKFEFKFRLVLLPVFFLTTILGTLVYSKEYRMILTIFLLIVTFYIYYYAFKFINNYRLCLKLLVFSFLLFALYFSFIYRNEILNLDINQRLGKYFDNENLIGCYFTIGFLLCFYVGVMCRSKIELLFIPASLIFLGLGLFTGSRSNVLLSIISLIVILFFRLRRHKLIFLIVFAVLIGAFIGFIQLPIFSFLKEQFSRTLYSFFGIGSAQKADASSIERVLYQSYGYFLGSKNLLIGYGCDGFAKYSGVGTYSHSNFAEVVCNFGIFGFVFYYLPFIVACLIAGKSSNKDRWLVFILTIYMFFRGFVGVSYYFKDAYLIFAIIFAAIDDVTFKKTANNKILYIASLNSEKNKYDGERIKSTYIYNSLIESYDVDCINLTKNKILQTTKLILKCMFKKNSYYKIIISKDPHGANIIYKIFKFLKIDFNKIIYFEIGPFLYDHINSGKINKKLFINESKIIVETDSMKNELLSLGFKNVDTFPNFKVIPNVSFYKKEYPVDVLKLVYFSRIEDKKGVFDLIDVVNEINKKKPIFKLDIFGLIMEKNDEEHLNELLKQGDPLIKYKGKLDSSLESTYATLQEYDLHIFPTKYSEGFPGTLIDFFICGVPTLSSTFERAKDILTNNESYFFLKGDNGSLKRELLKVYDDQNELYLKRKKTYALRNKYSVEEFKKYLKNILE